MSYRQATNEAERRRLYDLIETEASGLSLDAN